MEEKKGKQQKIVREYSAGGVVFKKSKVLSQKSKVTWLIVRPSGTTRWQLPKGRIDKGESSQMAALREVQEEGGIKARIIQKLDSQRYFFIFSGNKILKTVVFYLMEYVSGDPENHDKEVEESVFLSYDKAYGELTFKNDKEILLKARNLLESGVQASLV